MHGYVSFMAVGELERRICDLCDFAFGEQPQTVDKSQICHEDHLTYCSGVGRASRDWTARFAAAGETERDDSGWAGRPSPSTIDWETS